MWMMGFNDSSEFNMSDPFNGRRLRPLMPRPTSNTTTHPCLSHIHGSHLFPLNTHLASITEQNKKEFSAQPTVSSRWNPTPEQLRALEDLYRRGTRTPTAEQIQHITAHLRRFGKIEGKNVFYWFQNHKARERQKRRRCLESAAAAAATAADQEQRHEKNDSGSSRKGCEVEQNRNWVPPTNCSKLSEESVSMQRAAVAESRAEGWVQFEGRELQQRPSSAEIHATWQMIHLSCSPPTHLTKTITKVNPQLKSKDSPMKNTEECGDSNILQLFPLRDEATYNCGDGAKETKLSTQSMNSDFTPFQFFEFLPMKN